MNVAEVLSTPYAPYIRSADAALSASFLTWVRRFQCEELRRGCVVESSALERPWAASSRRFAAAASTCRRKRSRCGRSWTKQARTDSAPPTLPGNARVATR
jgi:hypothetical protein